MEFTLDIASFALKTFMIVAAIAIVLLIIIQSGMRSRKSRHGLDIENLNDRYDDFRHLMQSELLDKKELKNLLKSEKKEEKKAAKKEEPKLPRIFVMDFDGDIRATAVQDLREQITAILTVSQAGDEAVVRLESGGGLVTSYGLAASQLSRLKMKGIRLTICVDKIAASGGYMMACVADHIVAAPFAVLGSIGVIAQVPNFHKVLKKHDVDYREVTAGEFKRTVTVMGEITDHGMKKFKEQIEETHDLFKHFVKSNRPVVDIAQVATGEYWYGTKALELRLADQLSTSDDYLYSRREEANLYLISHQGKKKLSERLSESFGKAAHSLFLKIWGDLDRSRFGA
ncbi:MAG TPA: protease SohB [Bdellovibrionales bacterium]|nr:protease SohB [Bdellovibrionales bacterium]